MGILEKIKEIEFEARGPRPARRRRSPPAVCRLDSRARSTPSAARRWVELRRTRPRSTTWGS